LTQLTRLVESRNRDDDQTPGAHPAAERRTVPVGPRRQPPRGGWRRRVAFRSILAELIGTFSLTCVATGGPVIAAVTNAGLGGATLAVAPGLLVMAIVYTLGAVSGTHLNPVVTLGFAIRPNFPWR
jgi:aquaporin Z